MQEGALSLGMVGESDDESYYLDSDDEAYDESDDETFSERTKTLYGNRRHRPPPPRNYTQGLRGTHAARVTLPGGGSGQIRFDKNVVTTQELEKRLAMIRNDIKAGQDATTASITTLDNKFTSNLKQLRRSGGQSSMMPLLLTMMQPKPELDKIKFKKSGNTAAAVMEDKEITVESSAFKDTGDSTMLLLMMMMMGGLGGLTGSGDSQDKNGGDMQQMMMMMLLVQAMGK